MTSDAKATAASAPKPPAKERTPVPPEPGSIADLYREAIAAVDFEAEQTKWDVALTVPPEQLHHILKVSRDHPMLRMDLLRNQTAVDWLERGLEVVYHLYSTSLYHSVAIKTWVARREPLAAHGHRPLGHGRMGGARMPGDVRHRVRGAPGPAQPAAGRRL